MTEARIVDLRWCRRCNGGGTRFHHGTPNHSQCEQCEGSGAVERDDRDPHQVIDTIADLLNDRLPYHDAFDAAEKLLDLFEIKVRA